MEELGLDDSEQNHRRRGLLRADEDSKPEKATSSIPKASLIGAYLKGQRELRGVSIDELGALTRIPIRSLQRLEDGHFDGEVDGFSRGFVRTVALGLGLDADDTVARMLPEPVRDERVLFKLSKRWPWALLSLVLVMAFFLLFWAVKEWPQKEAHWPRGELDETVQRRDPVRDLAAAQGGLKSLDSRSHSVSLDDGDLERESESPKTSPP